MATLKQAGRALVGVVCAGACLAATTGCYVYRPVAASAVTPGQMVRTRLSGEGMLRLESIFGEPRRLVTGEVVESQSDHLLLLANTPLPISTMPDERLRQRLLIQQGEIMEVEQRTLDRQRTLAFVGLFTGGATAALYYYLSGKSSGRGPDDPAPGPDLLILRFGVPF